MAETTHEDGSWKKRRENQNLIANLLGITKGIAHNLIVEATAVKELFDIIGFDRIENDSTLSASKLAKLTYGQHINMAALVLQESNYK